MTRYNYIRNLRIIRGEEIKVGVSSDRIPMIEIEPGHNDPERMCVMFTAMEYSHIPYQADNLDEVYDSCKILTSKITTYINVAIGFGKNLGLKLSEMMLVTRDKSKREFKVGLELGIKYAYNWTCKFQ
ncbi:hypothetical protein D1T48_gp02 [Thermoproteus tenax virus 1]|uniref:Uncharacterized 14.8 kDa protein n=1 Tax=Thermoproteus tenax virus 1 (strain KRA1) TaxID=10480 RepID=YOR2_TTV1K|nr:hypothetical protein D1T48_gp02 [Thermoproteus tenax virus 1]P19277.1 RecName: Full=Uncharacterized 14.8 kDa protein [Thermoproteus tenax virus 1 (STRAIN KRA1)]CAA32970.1 unnamed protein product [Thermoproteus tenax virus 1]